MRCHLATQLSSGRSIEIMPSKLEVVHSATLS